MSKIDRTNANYPHAMYGLPRGFSIADLDRNYTTPVAVLTGVTVETLSAAISIGARSIRLNASAVNPATKFDLVVYADADVSSIPAAWSSGTGYVTGNLVTSGGLAYKALQNSTNKLPATFPAFWAPQAQANFLAVTQGKEDGLYVGGYDQKITLDGAAFRVLVTNIVTSSAITVTADATS